MAFVKNKIAILSGKGGVGKSTFTSQLAFFLAADPSLQVGVLDLDICGPSIPRMTGSQGERLHASQSGWSPVYVQDNLAVISVSFMLENADSAVIWRGPKKNSLIKQFLKDVDWGMLDYLLIDTPPGTSDEHLSLAQYLFGANSAILITTPQQISLQDVRKEIDFCHKVSMPILGIVENMSKFVCPHCRECSLIFNSPDCNGQMLASQNDIPFLGSIPLDPLIAASCENGQSIFSSSFEQSATVQAYRKIVENIKFLTE